MWLSLALVPHGDGEHQNLPLISWTGVDAFYPSSREYITVDSPQRMRHTDCCCSFDVTILSFRFLNASVFPQVCMASFATNDIHGYCKAIRVTDGSSVTLMREKGVKAERKWVAAHLSVNSRGLPTACHSYVMKEGKGDNLTRTVLKYNFHLFSSGNALFLALDKN